MSAHDSIRGAAGFARLGADAETLVNEYDAAIKALTQIKRRLHFMGWPAEAFWNAGTAEAPQWIADWRYEIALIENVLHGSPLTKPEKPDDTKPAHEVKK